MNFQVAVCGSGRPLDPETERLAYQLGAEIARQQWTLICGGLGGVMEAAARGAREAGGLVVGILPSDDRTTANLFCHVVIPTGFGIGRNVLVVQAADAVVLIGGGSGTLAEAALAWQLGKKIVALVPAGGWAKELAG